MTSIEKALRHLRALPDLDDDDFDPSDFDDGIDVDNPSPGTEFDPSNFEDWDEIDDDDEEPADDDLEPDDQDLDPADPGDDSDPDGDEEDSRGYCCQCGNEHRHPDPEDAAVCRRYAVLELERRPYSNSGFEYR